MTFDEMRAAEISRMGQNSARNPINMGWLPTGGDGQNQQALLDYLASIYGYNTQGNIAGYNGQVSLANTQLQNSGALDRANIGRDIAQFQDQGQSYRTGLSENAATQRSVFDNQGADYRAGLGMLANTYAPALQSDMRGYAMNNFASPLLQTLFGINPGTPYQTREMPTPGSLQQPQYGGGMPQVPSPPPPNYQAGAGGDLANLTQTVSNYGGGGAAASGGGGVRRITSPQQQQTGQVPFAAFRGQQAQPVMAQRSFATPNQLSGMTPVNRSPTAPRMSVQPSVPMPQAPQMQMPQQQGQTQYGQATRSQPPSVMQQLPTSFGGPKITTGGVMSENEIQGLVGRQQGFNAARQAGADRTAERATGAAGFASNSPQLMALKNQNGIARGFADQDAAVTIPTQYRVANAGQRLASEQAAANVYGQRRGEELQRRGQESGFLSNVLAQIMGLV